MRKFFHLPGWLFIRLCWPLFSCNHIWKMRRGFINYKCYSLEEWDNFIHTEMQSQDKLIQNTVVDGLFWIIFISFLFALFSIIWRMI